MQPESSKNTGPMCGDGTMCDHFLRATASSAGRSGKSTLFVADSLAKGYLAQTSEAPDSLIPVADCGRSSPGSLGQFAHGLFWPRTQSNSQNGGLDASSVTLPNTGTMRNGAVFLPSPWDRLTFGRGATLWPTVTASQAVKPIRLPCSSELRGHGRALIATIGMIAPELCGSYLTPTFAEWLMGFPPGWTDLDASETPSCRK